MTVKPTTTTQPKTLTTKIMDILFMDISLLSQKKATPKPPLKEKKILTPFQDAAMEFEKLLSESELEVFQLLFNDHFRGVTSVDFMEARVLSPSGKIHRIRDKGAEIASFKINVTSKSGRYYTGVKRYHLRAVPRPTTRHKQGNLK